MMVRRRRRGRCRGASGRSHAARPRASGSGRSSRLDDEVALLLLLLARRRVLARRRLAADRVAETGHLEDDAHSELAARAELAQQIVLVAEQGGDEVVVVAGQEFERVRLGRERPEGDSERRPAARFVVANVDDARRRALQRATVVFLLGNLLLLRNHES